jgi:glyoxylase-like metal-dependent hydrolase (beta-lactamase superfamily II)
VSQQPVSARLRVYHVGFGDCFLLSFRYDGAAAGERHVLIDFGTTQAPPNKKNILMDVARDIEKQVSEGELTAVVATHRHRDHIEGFRTSPMSDGSEPGDIIRRCSPKLVMQPWTEDPDLPTDAKAPRRPQALSSRLIRSRNAFGCH